MQQPLVSIGRDRPQESEPEPHVDPVCKMLVFPESAAANYEYEGAQYYFCMTGCRDKFAADPERFLSEPPALAGAQFVPPTNRPATHAAGSDVEYTCPMDPDIVQLGPGTCPKSGMALEPKEITLDDTPDAEFVDMKRRFWICSILN